MKTGEKIKAARKTVGLKQKEVAERLNVTPSMIAQYESGKRIPRGSTLYRIAQAIGCPLSDLTGGGDLRLSQEDWKAIINEPAGALPIVIKQAGRSLSAAEQAAAELEPGELAIDDKICLQHFRPLTDDNKDRALDYMDYLKSKQDKPE